MADMQQPYYQQPQRSKTNWWIPVGIIGALIGGAFIGVIVIFFSLGSFIGGLASKFESEDDKNVQVEKNSVLQLKFKGTVNEYESSRGFLDDESGTTFIDALAAIKHAATDEKIKGIYYTPGGSIGFAKQREIIAALEEFKKSGKFIYAFLPGGAERDYYFAAVADSIFMPQEAMFEFNGFGSTTAFLKTMFEKLGVEWYVVQREEYKSAAETFNRTSFSDPAREEIRALLDQRYRMFTGDVARYRKLSQESVQAALGRGIYDPDSLKALGFIDGFATELQMKAKLKKKLFGSDTSDETLNFVGLTDYASYARNDTKQNIQKDKKIAIVYGSGAIRSGRSAGAGYEIASGSFVRDLRKAADDKDVDAIILRIDSPGGSVQASDEIYHEILRAKAKKPVYASMSDVAASGGYYMAMACDTIVAHRETITGSIGVIASIPNVAKSCEKLGINIDSVTTGKAALFMDPGLPLSEADKQHLQTMIQSFYDRFLERVAQGRKSTPEKIREVARGRVWTGEAAKERGLVDVLGGLYTTIELAKKRIGADPNKRVSIVSYPKKTEQVEAILRMLNLDDEDEEEASEEARAAAKESINAAVQQYVQAQNPVWQQTWNTMPPAVREQLGYALQMMAISRREQVLAVLPWHLDIH
ncbi:MAG: signal peptide peptidase SppA [Candidatus Kapabacteria bacterium]|nr:signal peptide peptidase SppA [Candidatus Kapabacteria bacterium]